MKLANVRGRAVLVTGPTTGVDVARASDGVFGPDLQAGVYGRWDDFHAWAESTAAEAPADVAVEFAAKDLGSPSPSPKQIFAIGLNYSQHAAESGFAEPTELPPTFTKFASSLSGPDTLVTLPANGHTDWEVELVVVIGRETHKVSAAEAWGHVAGLTVGQDLSERITQLRGPAPQFGLGKSFPGFAPTGPWLVTPDEFPDPDALELGCAIDGHIVQQGSTRDLIFPVAALVSELSQILHLYPGDLIFTGTPAGVGIGQEPQRFLRAGEELVSWITGIGELRQLFTD